MCAINREGGLSLDKVIAVIIRLTFLAHPVSHVPTVWMDWTGLPCFIITCYVCSKT